MKLKEFWEKHEFKVVLLVVLVIITALSFEAGYLKGRGQKTNSVVIEKAPECPKISPGGRDSPQSVNGSVSTSKKPVGTNLTLATDMQNCPFVGSKNSDKYYPPTCSYAKRIKPENLVCFKTAQEAVAQGRTVSTGCKY